MKKRLKWTVGVVMLLAVSILALPAAAHPAASARIAKTSKMGGTNQGLDSLSVKGAAPSANKGVVSITLLTKGESYRFPSRANEELLQVVIGTPSVLRATSDGFKAVGNGSSDVVAVCRVKHQFIKAPKPGEPTSHLERRELFVRVGSKATTKPLPRRMNRSTPSPPSTHSPNPT